MNVINTNPHNMELNKHLFVWHQYNEIGRFERIFFHGKTFLYDMEWNGKVKNFKNTSLKIRIK